MKFNKFETRMFHQAHIEAEKSDYNRFKVGCVVTYKHTVIGRGCNAKKSHPLQKEYNRKYRKFNNEKGQCIIDSVHAEISALTSIPYTTGIEIDWSKVKVFVYRICPGKKRGYGNAKPCAACMNAIRDLGIRNVYYSDENGFNYLYLED